MKKPRILLFDIETSPNISYTWGIYEQNVVAVKKHWELLSFAYKWLGEKAIYCNTRSEYKSEKSLVASLWKLFDEADIIIAHNGDKFDIRKSKSKFLEHGFEPPSPYATVDTLKLAKKHYKFDSNRLNDLCTLLGIGTKVKHTGIELWDGCMNGDKRAWQLMEKYNKRDVALLEKLYMRLLPWIDRHPSVALLTGKQGCPSCGSSQVIRKGVRANHRTLSQQWHCKACGGWHLSPYKKEAA